MANRSLTPQPKLTNYPDVLGALTSNRRYTSEYVHLSSAVFPTAFSAGKSFDGILVAQNMHDADLDLLVRVVPPEKDLNGARGQIATRMDRPLRIGLRPGEVGYVKMPCISTAQTAPGHEYQLQIEVTIEPPTQSNGRVRAPEGGTPFDDASIPPDQRQHYRDLQPLSFSGEIAPKPTTGLRAALASKDNKIILLAPFTVTTPTITALPQPQKPEYFPLWVVTNYDPNTIPARLAQILTNEAPLPPPGGSATNTSSAMTGTLPTVPNLPALDRTTVFFPLLKYLQERYEKAEFKLWAGEAVMVTKLFTYVLEQGASPIPFRWKYKLREVIDAAGEDAISVEQLIIQELFADLVGDAATFAFEILSEATGENFGTPDEINEYADGLTESLRGFGAPLDMVQGYLPLILGGLILNDEVVMPKEKAQDTIGVFKKAVAQRSTSKDESNAFIFELVDTLLKLQD